MKASILYIEDDSNISQAVTDFLTAHDYQVIQATNGKEALDLIERQTFDIILLDLMLPDMSGESIAKMVTQQLKIPIIMTSAKVSEDEVVNGFESGAKDYLKKPFGLRELLARIEVLVPSHTISFNDKQLMIDPINRLVSINQKPIKLTNHEYQVLYTMVKHPSQVFTREQLILSAFGHQYEGFERTIDSHIKNLRSKIETNTKQPLFIETIRGIGYRFIGVRD